MLLKKENFFIASLILVRLPHTVYDGLPQHLQGDVRFLKRRGDRRHICLDFTLSNGGGGGSGGHFSVVCVPDAQNEWRHLRHHLVEDTTVGGEALRRQRLHSVVHHQERPGKGFKRNVVIAILDIFT